MPSERNRAAAALGACLILSGCADYLANRDSVTLGLGDAPQGNIGIQAINPFPPEASDTDIDGDGPAVARAQRQYVAGRTADLTPAQPIFLTTTGDATTTD